MSFAEDMGHDMAYDGWGDESPDASYERGGSTNSIIEYTELVHKTDKAVLLVIRNVKYWVPLSRITLNEVDNSIDIPIWLFSRLEPV